jgi:hypothetical protein
MEAEAASNANTLTALGMAMIFAGAGVQIWRLLKGGGDHDTHEEKMKDKVQSISASCVSNAGMAFFAPGSFAFSTPLFLIMIFAYLLWSIRSVWRQAKEIVIEDGKLGDQGYFRANKYDGWGLMAVLALQVVALLTWIRVIA